MNKKQDKNKANEEAKAKAKREEAKAKRAAEKAKAMADAVSAAPDGVKEAFAYMIKEGQKARFHAFRCRGAKMALAIKIGTGDKDKAKRALIAGGVSAASIGSKAYGIARAFEPASDAGKAWLLAARKALA